MALCKYKDHDLRDWLERERSIFYHNGKVLIKKTYCRRCGGHLENHLQKIRGIHPRCDK